jgi:outer membrane receptor protein involved in Fe transport
MMSLRTPVACTAALLVALGAWAADPPPAEERPAQESPVAEQPKESKGSESERLRYHEEITVTASKTAQAQKDVTQTVRVIDAEEIERLPKGPNRNLSELLSYEPGNFVSALSRNDANWGSNGGMGPKYNSYLLEGQPIDAFVDGMSLDPWALERVEVQRGPAAVMYSNYLAMDFAGNQTPLAGITNYVLRDRIDSPLTRIQLGGGSWATVNAQAYTQARAGALHYFMGGSYERSDYTNYGTPGSWLSILDDPQYTKLKLYGKGTVFLGRDDQSLSLFAHYTGHTGDVGRPNRDFDHSYGTINAAYQNRLSDALDLQVKGGARLYGRRWGEDRYPESLALREHDGVEQTVFPGDVTFSWRHSGESRLTLGADTQYATYETYAEADGPRTKGNDATAFAAGLFAQEQLVVSDFVLRGGLRYGYSEQSYTLLSGASPGVPDKSWSELLWSAGMRWNASPELAVFTNAGSSFVAPTPKAVGGTLQSSDLGVAGRNGQLPNAELKPESGVGGDLGADLRLPRGLKLGVRGFLNRIDDVIVDNVVSQDPSQTRSSNAGNATSYGVEVALDQAVSRSVSWFVNGTYTHSRIENPLDLDQDGADIPFVPDWTANAGASVSLPRGFTVSPYLRAVGSYYDGTSKSGRQSFGKYVIPALRVESLIPAGAGADVVLTLDLNNLTNNRYAMPWQFRDPGFSAFGTVSVRLK